MTDPDMSVSLAASVDRTTSSGRVLGPKLAISRWEALKAVTSFIAIQYAETDTKGRIAPDLRADLIIVGRNPLTGAGDESRGLTVLRTVKDGQVVYRG